MTYSRSRRVKDAGEIEAAKPVQEGLAAEHVSALLEATEAQPGDLLLIAAGPTSTVNKCACICMGVSTYKVGQVTNYLSRWPCQPRT